MSKAIVTTLEVLTKDQSEMVEGVKAYHAACISGFKQQMGYAFLAGIKLSALKEALPNGYFLAACEKFLPEISVRTCQRYMKFSDSLALNPPGGKCDTVSYLKNGELTDEAEAKVLKAVYKAADGKSLTELYRDLGVIREKKPDGGFRPNAAAVQEWLKKHHPDFAGIKFDELPPGIQKEFKKQYRPAVDPDALLESKRAEWDEVHAHMMRLIDENYPATVCTTAQKLKALSHYNDAGRAVRAVTKEGKK